MQTTATISAMAGAQGLVLRSSRRTLREQLLDQIVAFTERTYGEDISERIRSIHTSKNDAGYDPFGFGASQMPLTQTSPATGQGVWSSQAGFDGSGTQTPFSQVVPGSAQGVLVPQPGRHCPFAHTLPGPHS